MKVYCVRHDSECIKKDDGFWYCKDGSCGVISITKLNKCDAP